MDQNHSVSATFIRVSPPNDDFVSSQLISSASASVNGTTKDATRDSGEPNHCLDSADCSGTNGVLWPGDHTVWYSWTAPYSGSWKMDTCTTNYDSLLSVSTRRISYPFVQNNNGCSSGYGSKLTFDAQKDQTYYVGVDGCCGAPQGTFTLALNLVDDVAPETQITQGPKDGSATSNTSVTFAFDADEPGSTFRCRVYSAALTPPAFDNCSGTGTHTASGFSQGTYTFEVRATDAAGNPDQTPAKRTSTVDTTKSTVLRGFTPTGTGVSPTAKPTVKFSEKMDEASVEASTSGKPTTFFLKKGTTKVAATVRYVETATGQYKAIMTPASPLRSGVTYAATVTTSAKDVAGNTLAKAKTWTFTVK
jgi:hypothetical protein